MPADRPAAGPVTTAALRPVLALGRRWTAALACAAALSTGCALLLPTVLARAVDRATAGAGPRTALPLVALVLLFAAAEAASQYAAPRGAAAVTAGLRRAVVRRAVADPPGAPGLPERGDLAARLTGSAPQAALAGAAVVHTAGQLVTAAGAVVGLFLLAPRPACAFLLAAPAGWLLIRRQVMRTAGHGEAYQAAQAAIATALVEALRGSRSIAAAGAVRAELARVLEPLPEVSRHGHGLWRSQRATAWRVGLLVPVTQVAVLLAAGADLAAARLSPGGLAAVTAYATLGLGGFGAAQSLLDLARARAGAARVAGAAAPAPPGLARVPLPAGGGRLEFRAVRSPAGGRPRLAGVDLVVPAGRWTAVVGADDASTSALATLAAGLARPAAGEVRLDGVDLAAVRPEELRAAVAVAFTDPVLFGATVADALTLGQDTVPEAGYTAAARAAGADLFVRRLPAGYRTAVADAPMSGGERQRLGLARALCRDFRLLVLDDATSALDRAAEESLADALREATAGRTVLCATRSPVLAGRADAVAWLVDGRVRAVAPHAVLCREPGYRALFATAPAVRGAQ
ncbi:ABC transporter ATP-binding protein [Streptomyces sp. TLI_171]|uniref:ATP-binding cassette domain-containing protein n=1 Tax=Streptomyces sp. TLI_171 TaxID=1938859 RepID=UPI000C4BDEE3|nr:ABC transporter ATP-binding protein [Streptomyces sp. TLI_171]RKE17394.1 ATP-binding cassette subfamily B protein [Streptomyces sp. TLI_171]